MLTLPGLCLSKAHLQFGDCVKFVLFGGEVEAGYGGAPVFLVADLSRFKQDMILHGVALCVLVRIDQLAPSQRFHRWNH